MNNRKFRSGRPATERKNTAQASPAQAVREPDVKSEKAAKGAKTEI
jgi:hypothetical protein